MDQIPKDPLMVYPNVPRLLPQRDSMESVFGIVIKKQATGRHPLKLLLSVEEADSAAVCHVGRDIRYSEIQFGDIFINKGIDPSVPFLRLPDHRCCLTSRL